MKFHFQVVNNHLAGSCCNVHMFSLYPASDCYSNMATVLLPYYKEILELQKEPFRISGHKVCIFLSGDSKFLDAASVRGLEQK